MRRFFIGLALVWSFVGHAKSSEIPLKREFPINATVSPCADFYEYACSAVMDSFQLRDDRSVHDFAFGDSSERILTAKKKFFTTLATAVPRAPREAMLKNYFVACMDQSARRREEKALVTFTKKWLGEIQSREALEERMASNRLIGEASAVGFFSLSNQDRPLYNDLALHTGWLTLPEKSFYLQPAVVEELRKVIQQFFKTVGDANPEQSAKVVVAFESGLAREYPSPVEFRDIMEKRTGISREELLATYPHLQLASLISLVPESTLIRHLIPKAMNYLEAQLAELPLSDLKAIYLYNSLYRELDDAYPKYFQARFDFENRNFGGPKVRPDREERCTRGTMARFTAEVDEQLWPKLFPGFPKEKVTAVAEKIRAAIAASLKENKWLSSGAKREALNKITLAQLQLVAPRNDDEWDFRTLTSYSPKAPVQNSKLFTRMVLEKQLAELNGPVSPYRWGMGPLTVNAYYDESFNKFVLPAGILQYPFFDPGAPEELNLAAIGSVIGHELGHGIDDKGSLYDSKGRLVSWMTPADVAEFKKRTQILIEQFNHAGHNGALTLGENIGDLVGLTASHRAAFGSSGQKGRQKLEQEFYTQYARAWCTVQRPKHAELQLKQNPHSLGRARVNEQMKQQPAFAEAFQCKPTDAMVLPSEKIVRLW